MQSVSIFITCNYLCFPFVGIISGEYEDDFETLSVSDDGNSDDGDGDRKEGRSESGDSDLELDDLSGEGSENEQTLTLSRGEVTVSGEEVQGSQIVSAGQC